MSYLIRTAPFPFYYPMTRACLFLFLLICLGATDYFLSTTDATKIPSNVLELNERFLDVMDHGFWFVEFYAPWCAHCKKLMPMWEHMAHTLSDKQSPIRVGKLDCTRFPSVAAALRVNGYPTVIFFRNGVQIHYEGERRREELVKFAEKCAGPVVDRIDSQAKFTELRKICDREPFFVFYDPLQRAKEDGSFEQSLWRQYENVSELFFTEVNFYEVHDIKVLPDSVKPTGNETTVLIFKDLDYLSTFDAMEDLTKWVGQQRWPLLPLITASNIHTIAHLSDKKLVLAPIDGLDRLNASTETGRFFEMLTQAATEARKHVELETNFQFGWMDGNQIANGIVMNSLSMPNLFVFNLSSYEYYFTDDQPEQMTPQSLLLFLSSIQQGSVEVHGGRAWITRLRRMIYEVTSNIYDMFQHQPILTVCLFGVPLAFFSIITYSICSADFSVERDEIYPDDEDEDLQDEEDDFTYVTSEALEGTHSQQDEGHEKAE